MPSGLLVFAALVNVAVMLSPACKPTMEPVNAKFVAPYIRFVLLPVTVNGAGLTVRRKLVLALRMPSFTVRVMVADPRRFEDGVTVTVRLVPEPPKTMLFVVTRFVLDEEADNTRFEAAVKES